MTIPKKLGVTLGWTVAMPVALAVVFLTVARGDAPQAHGVKDFQVGTHLFVVPPGVGSLEIEAWGGGGGGAACPSGVGGGGGGGGYVHGVVSVLPNRGYDITVGAGGAAGYVDATAAGSVGGTTSFELSGSTLIAAFGGAGGSGPIPLNQPGGGGCGINGSGGGAGGGGNPNGGILVSGLPGSGPSSGAGGDSLLGNRLPPASKGGRGRGADGDPGSPGYMIVRW